MQKKKTEVSKGKAKSGIKAVAKKAVKTVAKAVSKAVAKKDPPKSVAKKIEKNVTKKPEPKKQVKAVVEVAQPVVATKAQKIKENKEALKHVSEKNNKKIESDNYVSTVDTKKLSAEQLENYKKWLKLQRQHGEEAAPEYQMTQDFETKSTLKHKIHGWGVVLQRRDNYIDVLFEMGMKTLVCNYKA